MTDSGAIFSLRNVSGRFPRAPSPLAAPKQPYAALAADGFDPAPPPAPYFPPCGRFQALPFVKGERKLFVWLILRSNAFYTRCGNVDQRFQLIGTSGFSIKEQINLCIDPAELYHFQQELDFFGKPAFSYKSIATIHNIWGVFIPHRTFYRSYANIPNNGNFVETYIKMAMGLVRVSIN